MKLTLETTTGLLVPAGVAPPLGRGSEKILLRFVTNGVATLLPDDASIALKLWLASVDDDPIATLAAWAKLTADVAYRATIDARTIAELAWRRSGVIIGRIDYGEAGQSQAFQLNYGAGTAAGGGGAPQVIVPQRAVFVPAFVELEGASPALKALDASTRDVGRILQGTVNDQLKSYQVRAGNDAEDLPGIVRPANYADETNEVVFVQL